jgi:hypothetical protein
MSNELPPRGKKVSSLARLFPTVAGVDRARKYLSKAGGPRWGVRFRCISWRFRRSWEFDCAVWLACIAKRTSGTSAKTMPLAETRFRNRSRLTTLPPTQSEDN